MPAPNRVASELTLASEGLSVSLRVELDPVVLGLRCAGSIDAYGDFQSQKLAAESLRAALPALLTARDQVAANLLQASSLLLAAQCRDLESTHRPLAAKTRRQRSRS